MLYVCETMDTFKARNIELQRIEKEKEINDMIEYKKTIMELETYNISHDVDISIDNEPESSRRLICVRNGCFHKPRYGQPDGSRKRCDAHKLPTDVFIPYVEPIKPIRKKRRRITGIVGPIPEPKPSTRSEYTEIPRSPIPEPDSNTFQGHKIVPRSCPPPDYSHFNREEFINLLKSRKKKFECPYPHCNYRCRGKISLQSHIYSHEGVKPFRCPYEWCDYRGTTEYMVRQHMKTNHSREGYIRKLSSESRVIRALKKWGLGVDTDITIDASRNGCLTDTERLYSRVDIVVTNVTSCVLILEVDEFAHESPNYNVTCELSRMADIGAFLRLNSYTKPIYWIRYNPNGKYFVGEQEKKIPQNERELALKNHIFSMMEPDFVPDKNESIMYMFYSRTSETGPPKILENSEFPEYVKNIVSWWQ